MNYLSIYIIILFVFRYEQCMDLQLFYRDTEQADTWMVKQESFLVNQDLGDSLDSVEVRSPFIIIFFLI